MFTLNTVRRGITTTAQFVTLDRAVLCAILSPTCEWYVVCPDGSIVRRVRPDMN